MNTVQANINNLTSLWRTVGERAQAHTLKKDFEFSAVDYSEWPNKLWFRQGPNENNISAAKAELQSQPTKLVIPHWDIFNGQSFKLFEENGFLKSSELIGMSLKLNRKYKDDKMLQFKKVDNLQMSKLWENLFHQAFNYTISHKLIQSSFDTVDYLIAYHKDTAVGTGVMHYTDNVVGIHSMGIVPEMRRKGYANKMMVYMLNQAIDGGYEYATLQASAMGKGLYLKLGFSE